MKACKCENCRYTKVNGGYMVCLNHQRNTPIEELIKEYDMENITNEKLMSITTKYISTMEDCQVRCILHILKERISQRSYS